MRLRALLITGLIVTMGMSPRVCLEPVHAFQSYMASMNTYTDINPVQKVILSLVLAQAKPGVAESCPLGPVHAKPKPHGWALPLLHQT